MWKALLVLFVISDQSPPSTMLGQFKQVFTTQEACQKFVAGKAQDLNKQVKLDAESDAKVKVIGHRTSCVRDRSGVAI